MGSSGSGSFSDYPGGSGSGGAAGKPGGGVGGGGSSGSDPCDRAFEVELEDVGQSEYFAENGQVPPIGAAISITRKKRVVAVLDSGEVIGNLPTAHNDLAGCIEDGWTYAGSVVASGDSPPAPTVTIEVAGIAP